MHTASNAASAKNAPHAAAPKPERARYTIDPGHASAQFKVRHLMVSQVRGELGEVTGEVIIDAADPERSSVVASIDAAAIDTRNPARDEHLRSADFLDVASHPRLHFRSTSVRSLGDGRLSVSGELTIRGVTRPVTLEAELSDEIRDPWGHVKRGVSATAQLDRREWGLVWNAAMDGGGLVVGERVDIVLDAELVRSAAPHD